MLDSLKNIPYRIAKWFFKKYLDKLIQEHTKEIAERSWLVTDIVNAELDWLEDEIEKFYMMAILGEVDAKNEQEAIEKSEKIMNDYVNSINEIEDLREKFSSVRLKYSLIITMVKTVAIVGVLYRLAQLYKIAKGVVNKLNGYEGQ